MVAGKDVLDYVILTATYNRAPLLEDMAAQLADECTRAGFRAVHFVINDGSTVKVAVYKAVESRYLSTNPYSMVMRWQSSNGGAQGFWATVNRGFELIKPYQFKYFVMMPDDHRLCDRFLATITEAFEGLVDRDPGIAALNVHPPLLRNYGTNRYLDDAFISGRSALDALGWKLFDTVGPWKDNFKTGSGTGFQMTRRLESAGLKIAPNQDVSYSEVLDVPSAMFANRPHPKLWTRPNFIGLQEKQCQ